MLTAMAGSDAGKGANRRGDGGDVHVGSDGDDERASRRRRRAEMPVDHAVSRLASTQLGNVHRDQLLVAGVGPRAIDNWIARGRLIWRFRSVYALAHRSLPPFSLEMAAVLACGQGALLSSESAGYLWGLRPAPKSGLVDVTVVARHIRRQQGIRLHHVADLQASDITIKGGIPITSPARTLIDMAHDLDGRELELALHEGIATRLFTINRVKQALVAYPRRRGTALLAELVNSGGPSTITKPGGEEKLFQMLRRAGLVLPHTNAPIGRWTVDMYWPEHRLVVEVDGNYFHSTRTNIERDHRKDLELRKLDVDVLRFTGRQVERQPEMTLATVAFELGRRDPTAR
jgi:very-short-patch-repair endonuclease